MTATQRVLIVSIDSTMAHAWAACCDRGLTLQAVAADLVIADLDCPVPACWNAGPRLRAALAHTPLPLLAHERPSARYLLQHEPCRCLQKPFDISETVREIRALFASPS